MAAPLDVTPIDQTQDLAKAAMNPAAKVVGPRVVKDADAAVAVDAAANAKAAHSVSVSMLKVGHSHQNQTCKPPLQTTVRLIKSATNNDRTVLTAVREVVVVDEAANAAKPLIAMNRARMSVPKEHQRPITIRTAGLTAKARIGSREKVAPAAQGAAPAQGARIAKHAHQAVATRDRANSVLPMLKTLARVHQPNRVPMVKHPPCQQRRVVKAVSPAVAAIAKAVSVPRAVSAVNARSVPTCASRHSLPHNKLLPRAWCPPRQAMCPHQPLPRLLLSH